MHKSLEVIESQVSKCMVAGQTLVITNQEEYDQALIVGKKVSTLLKMIEEDEKKITKPINDSLKMIRDKYRPFKTQVETVKEDIKNKMTKWFNEEEKKKRIAEERIVARVEKGTLTEATSVAKLVKLQENAPISNGSQTSILVVKIIDIKLIPEKYLLINESLIKEDYRKGIEISGTECSYEKKVRL